MPVHDLNEYFRLSSALNFQLSASDVSWEDVLESLLDGEKLPDEDVALLLRTIEYASRAYSGRYRKLGPLYILHPLRAVALLANVSKRPRRLDLLMAILHDKLEDITAESCGERWGDLEREFQGLLGLLEPGERSTLLEGLGYLTRDPLPSETYYTYITRLMQGARRIPSLVEIKLADRLDNTMDMRIDVRDPLDWNDFYARTFELLFVRDCPPYKSGIRHPRSSRMNGADRLYELFKNVVTLSLIRQCGDVLLGGAAETLFQAICHSSIREAQRVIMHIFDHHLTDVAVQRRLLVQTMDYCIDGGIDTVTSPGSKHPLDGFVMEAFDHPDPSRRVAMRRSLYDDKSRMVMGACGFIVIFLRFLHQPAYYLHGVGPAGLQVPAPR